MNPITEKTAEVRRLLDEIDALASATAPKVVTLTGKIDALKCEDDTTYLCGGAWIDGGLGTVVGGGKNVRIIGLTVKNVGNADIFGAAIVTGDGWTLEDVLVEWCEAAGIRVTGNRVTLRGCSSSYNGVQGIKGIDASDVLLENCATYDNNRGIVAARWRNYKNPQYQTVVTVNGKDYAHPDFEAGGGKWWHCKRVVIRNHKSRFNLGPNLWFDYESEDVQVIGGDYTDAKLLGTSLWQSVGIRVEIQSKGPILIRGVKCFGHYGGDITNEHSSNVTIEDSELLSNPSVVNRDQPRGSAPDGTVWKIRNALYQRNRWKAPSVWWASPNGKGEVREVGNVFV